MLQQTRVSTVLPYFDRWLKQFPDFAAVAAASEEVILKAWEGLGYYSRARNLQKLAQQIVNLDEIPTESTAWEKLPGAGPYVAAAVTSISFGTKTAVVDGNVVRVLALGLVQLLGIVHLGATPAVRRFSEKSNWK